MGQDISGGNIGWCTSLSSDGSILAASRNSGNYVAIYEWNDVSWNNIGILREINPSFGWSISLSGNGNIIAASDPTGTGNGNVYIYERDGINWNQIGDLSGDMVLIPQKSLLP